MEVKQDVETDDIKSDFRLFVIACGILLVISIFLVFLVTGAFDSKVKGKTYINGSGFSQVDIHFIDNENCEIITREVSGGTRNPVGNTYTNQYKYKIEKKTLYIKKENKTIYTFILSDDYKSMVNIGTGATYSLRE